MTTASALENLLKRDRQLVMGGLGVVIVASWAYILAGAGMSMEAINRPMAWTVSHASMMFFMWWIMMIAMMLPSAVPMIQLYAMVNRKQAAKGGLYVPTGIFAAAYLVTWGLFSLFATLAQWGLERTGLMSSMMASTSEILSGVLLLAAGLWQLTPLKHACLQHCRSPLHHISHNWRTGRAGAFRMGVEHGAYCLGCCWVLMGLLFYGGVMNLYWITGLAAYVLIEKLIPSGPLMGRLFGCLSILGGGALILSA